MAVRTTEEAVKLIIEYDTNLIPDLTPFIDAASLFIDTIVNVVPVPSDDLLEILVRYMTAHLIKTSDPIVNHTQVKSLQESFEFRLSGGLGLSHYGSALMILDTTGRLSRYNQQSLAGMTKPYIFWAGTDIDV